MKRKITINIVAVLVGLLLSPGEATPRSRVISWTVISTYTDNTPIESQYIPVLYDIYRMDNVTKSEVQIANGITTNSYTFEDNTLVPGRVYIFKGRTRLNDGRVSDNSANYNWTLIYVAPYPPDNILTRRVL